MTLDQPEWGVIQFLDTKRSEKALRTALSIVALYFAGGVVVLAWVSR
jgi:hypothetical protein